MLIDSIAYTVLIQAYLHEGKTQHAIDVLMEMDEHGVMASTYTYNSLLKASIKDNNLEEACTIFNIMVEGAFYQQPDITTYHAMINACVNNGWTKKASPSCPL